MTKKDSTPAPLATEPPAMAKPAAAQEAPAAPGPHPHAPQGAQAEPAAAGPASAPAQAPAVVGRHKYGSSVGDVKDYLLANQAAMAKAMPRHVRPDALMRCFVTAVSKDSYLQKATPRSLYSAILQSTILGLECNTVLQHTFLIAYYNTQIKSYEAQLQIGWRGLCLLARNAGEIEIVRGVPVYAKDTIDIDMGFSQEPVKHKIYLGADRGEIIGCYATFETKSGARDADWMPMEEILGIARRSKTYKPKPDGSDFWSGPWERDRGEMARKTPLKRLLKRAPTSVERIEDANRLAAAAAVDNSEYGEKLDNDMLFGEAGLQLPDGAEERPAIADPKETEKAG